MRNWFNKSRTAAGTGTSHTVPLHALKRQLRIVVVDDDRNAFPVEDLKREGYSIEYWERVSSLSRLEAGSYDIIILDIGGVAEHLSSEEKVDGLAVLSSIKKANPGQVVIAFSGQSFAPSKQHFFASADDVLEKPADVMQCKQVIDDAMLRNFTPARLLEGLRMNLIKMGVSERDASKAVSKISKLDSGDLKSRGRAILERITEGEELADRAFVWVARLVALS